MSETILGVIIGGAIGIISTLISNLVQRKNMNLLLELEQKQKKKENIYIRKEKTYIESLEVITEIIATTKFLGKNKIDMPNATKLKINSIRAKMALYSTNEISEFFYVDVINAIVQEEKDMAVVETYEKMLIDDLDKYL